ncbi:MAG: TatD family hydrolase [Rickettsiales bacterium]|nr:TatD family hydrolase [Rickettsiales bacterium]
MLVDSHCHLNYPQIGALQEVVGRAEAVGVRVLQTICTKMHEFPDVLAIAEQFPHVYASVGIHPHEAGNERVTTQEIVERAQHSKVIGIGESGLDYYYEHSPREAQAESFRQHIAASRETGCPLIVHTRDADEDTIAILEDEQEKGAFSFLIHCFSSSDYLANQSVELGGYISLSGILTFKKAEALRESAKHLPLERLLVETDAPYLAPVPYRGKPCEPAYTRYTAECLAELRGISYEEVAKATTDNFFRLFTKAKRPV